MNRLALGIAALLAASIGPAGENGGAPPAVRAERPRILLRAKPWEGPTAEKIRGWMDRPEYRKRLKDLPKKPLGNALLWVVKGDRQAGKLAVGYLVKTEIETGSRYSTPSVWGDNLQYQAILYDWLHDHPDFDGAARKAKREHLEKWADTAMDYLRNKTCTVFYCRVSAAFAGLTFAALALHGDSPKAGQYLSYAQYFLKEKMGTIRQVEDGATGGGSYGLQIEMTHLAHLAAAWRSATDWDAAAWIREHQGNWLERQLLFQIWTTYPDGSLVKHGDLWDASHADRLEYRMQVDALTGMYRSGVGRTWADGMYARWGTKDYYVNYTWEFFLFNDPEVPPAPLAGLGRADVFSPELHGYVCWRSSWEPDATLVHFVCGETVDHHGTYDQGKFMIFKHAPLAIKNGAYTGGYMGVMHMYYKSPWSANSVVFTGEGKRQHGYQPRDIEISKAPSWKEWKAARDAKVKRPPTGRLVVTEANDRFARAVGDLTGACAAYPDTSWRRELVFLGYKYLLVLDRVKAGPGISHRWLLHTVNPPTVEGTLVTADNGKGRLFSKTLLPEGARLTDNSGPGKEYLHVNTKGTERTLPNGKWSPAKMPREMHMGRGRVDVAPADGAAECVYLHVLFPTEAATAKMPDCSVERKGADLVVKVDSLEHTFANGK
jgi:hypothetical protein